MSPSARKKVRERAARDREKRVLPYGYTQNVGPQYFQTLQSFECYSPCRVVLEIESRVVGGARYSWRIEDGFWRTRSLTPRIPEVSPAKRP